MTRLDNEAPHARSRLPRGDVVGFLWQGAYSLRLMGILSERRYWRHDAARYLYSKIIAFKNMLSSCRSIETTKKMKLVIKNYRCFVEPAVIELRKGFTAFTGVNNAGKSAIMRFLLEFRNLFQLISEGEALRNAVRNKGTPGFALQHVNDPTEVFSNLNNRGIELTFEFPTPPGRTDIRAIRVEIERNLNWKAIFVCNDSERSGTSLDVDRANKTVGFAGPITVTLPDIYEPCAKLARTLYIGPFRNTINIGTNENYLDIKIGQSFIEHFEELKTGPSKRSNSEISDLIESIRHIFRFHSLDISATHDKKSLHITINNKPYKQHELGSGLAQFVIVLASAALSRPEYILIDEPELNLHPALQLDFLTTLGKYASEAVWFSTHSIGLARSAGDQVYTVTRKSDGNSAVKLLAGSPRLSELLGEMSFSSQKELGFEKILLVEGPTEVKVFQHFLRLVDADQKYVILPLHGNIPELEQLEEIWRITTETIAIIDSERSAAGQPLEQKRQRFIDTFKQRGMTAHALDRAAMENYFPDKIVKAEFGPNYRALTAYEKLKDISPRWSKNQNWKLANAMTLDDLKNTDLGEFVSKL